MIRLSQPSLAGDWAGAELGNNRIKLKVVRTVLGDGAQTKVEPHVSSKYCPENVDMIC